MKYVWIEENRDQYSVARMCRQLEVSRTGYCQWRKRKPSERSVANMALDVHVAAIHNSSKRSYGRPRIMRGLRDCGLQVGHERVRNSLNRQGLRPVYKRPFRITTDSDHDNPVAPNVLDRRFDGWGINQAWVGDITYVETAEGWLYLACVMDLSSRRIVGWSMSERMKTDLVSQALKSAYGLRKQRHSPQTDPGLSNGSVDEPARQLLGQRRNGEFFQDIESRTRPSSPL